MIPVIATWIPVHAWVTGLSQAAAGSLVAAIWQGVLLAAAAGLGLRLLPKTPAAVRFAIWFGVFLLLAALPIAALWPRRLADFAPPASHHGAWLVLDERWCVALVGVWAVASAFRAVTLIAAALRVRALWRRATPIERLASMAAPNARRAQVCTSNEVDRPTVIGFFAPKILIPDWLIEKLTPAELEHVILHEAGHLGRADDWMNLIQKVALVVFPLNPVLAWVERRLCFERELACDERVLRATGAPKAYAECLANLVGYRLQRRSFSANLALALGALGRESELGRRVKRILLRGERMKPSHARIVLGTAAVLLLAAATGLERCPQIVSFSAPRSSQPDQAVNVAALLPPHGYHAVSLRMPATPASPWKSIGDAEPALAKASLARARRPALHAATTASESRQPAAVTTVAHPKPVARPFRAIQTVAGDKGTYRAPMLVVTRWVTVTESAPDGTRVVRSMEEVSSQPVAANAPLAGQLHSYAAVPVQGGWLVFQL